MGANLAIFDNNRKPLIIKGLAFKNIPLELELSKWGLELPQGCLHLWDVGIFQVNPRNFKQKRF